MDDDDDDDDDDAVFYHVCELFNTHTRTHTIARARVCTNATHTT